MTNKIKPIAIGIPLPFYKDFLLVSIYQSDKEFKKVLLEYEDISEDDHKELLDNNCGARCYYNYNKDIGVIRVVQKAEFPVFMGALAHEIAHYVFMMLSNKGLKHCDESEEAYTYLIEYLTRTILENV